MIRNTCEVCQSKKHSRIDVLEMMFGMKHSFQYLLCRDCGSLSLQNIPKNLGIYYPEDYYSFTETDQKGFKELIKYKIEQYSLGEVNLFGYIFSRFFGVNPNFKAIKLCNPNREETSILDIGCGNGMLLKKLSQQGFKKLNGIDPYLAEDIVNENLTVRKASIDDLFFDKKSYDIIMMSHVLEHMENPNKQLQKLYILLDNYGKLIIRVPISSSFAFEKFRSNWFQIDAPRHLFIPSLKGMFICSENQNLKLLNYFFDSSSAQFTVSRNYSIGIPLIDQNNESFFGRLSLRRFYHSIVAKILNKRDKGDQATFIFSKKVS